MYYDYTPSKQYCESIGLVWFGDDYLVNIDREAWMRGFSQEDVDWCVRTHLHQVKFLFTPKSYGFLARLALAFYFLTGLKPSKKGYSDGGGNASGG